MEMAKSAAAIAREAACSDRPMIYLNIGEPDFTAPLLVAEAAERAIRDGKTQYTQATGSPEQRERISAAGTASASARLAGAPHRRHRRRLGRAAAGLPGLDRSGRRGADARPQLPLQPPVRQHGRGALGADPVHAGRALPAQAPPVA